MKEIVSQPVAEDDEIDILEILGILLSKWPLLLSFVVIGAAVGLFVSNYIRPVYMSDALLQVDQNGNQAGLAMGDMGALLDVASPADAEIQLLQSRHVLESVVDGENLAYSATPVALLPRLSHREGRVDLGFLRIPRTRMLEKWFLRVSAGAGSDFEVLDPEGAVALSGKIGESYCVAYDGDTLGISVLRAVSSIPGEKFLLGETDPRIALDILKSRLTVAEQGKKTGIIQIRIAYPYPDRAASILNTLSDSYVRQNVEVRSAEASKTLEFLKTQLPGVKAKLDSSEYLLSDYRKKEGSIDLSGEARSALDKRMELESQQLELEQKFQETARLFKEDHPSVAALKRQIDQVRREIGKLGEATKNLPDKQQEILRLQGDVDVNNSIYTSMLNNMQQLQVVRAGEVGNVRIVDRARVELLPTKPKKTLILAGSVLGALVLCCVLIFLNRLRSSRGVRSASEIERTTGVSVYAKIPETKMTKSSTSFTLVSSDPENLACESLRTLRTALDFSFLATPSEKTGGRVLLVSGLTPGIGKSFVSKNLAELFVHTGKKVLLIDADLRMSKLSPRGRRRGLTDCLMGKIPLENAIEKMELSKLDLLGAGSLVPSPAEMVSSKVFENLVKDLRSRYDLILIDTPPVLLVTDAQIMCKYADFALVVVRYGKNTMEDLEEALSLFDQVNMKNRAIVLNRCIHDRGHAYGYGYSYGYGYGKKYKYGGTDKKES